MDNAPSAPDTIRADDNAVSNDSAGSAIGIATTDLILGIDFGGTKIATAVCDLSGRRLATRVIDAEPDGGARAAFDRGVRAAKALLAETAIDRPLAGVGVSTFGIPSENGVALAPAIEGWEDLAMGRDLREAFEPAPVTMATDVKAAALAEARWGALAGVDPGVYLNLGTGLAAADRKSVV